MKHKRDKLYHYLKKKQNKIEKCKPTHLYSDDFKNGTYIIDKPGYYILCEDIVFNPNPENNYMPYPDDPKYQTLGYSLGFFAAIVIASKNVYLNLNNYTIQQSIEFALQQRFYANIELADAPFIPNQGPGDFSTSVKSARKIIIRNGTLGRSSHHGIHGNFAKCVLLENITVTDFEVAGISLNGSDHIIVNKVCVRDSRQDIPVLATYSAARFATMFGRRLLTYDLDQMYRDKLIISLDTLEELMNTTFTEVVDSGQTTVPLFRNETGLLDGNIYGILFHPHGVAVDALVTPQENKCHDIFINRTHVKNLKTNVNEIIALSKADGSGAQNDVAGAVLQIANITNDDGTYKSNELADLQILLAEISLSMGMQLGKNTIDQAVVDWSHNNTSIDTLLEKNYTYKCNGDSMFHVNKGAIGYRLDGIEGFIMSKSSISKLENLGKLGNEVYCGPYKYSHDNQKEPGYGGCNVSGVSLSYCNKGELYKVLVDGLYSENGSCIGINNLNKTRDVCIDRVRIGNLLAGRSVENESEYLWKGVSYYGLDVEYNANYPNKVPNAVGIKVSKNSCVNLGERKIGYVDAAGAEVPVWTN